MPSLHEMQIITELQRETALGNSLKNERGGMIIEMVVREQVKTELFFNDMKSKSLGYSPKVRELFRDKKYCFAQLPFRT